jgi:hypothetical protein
MPAYTYRQLLELKGEGLNLKKFGKKIRRVIEYREAVEKTIAKYSGLLNVISTNCVFPSKLEHIAVTFLNIAAKASGIRKLSNLYVNIGWGVTKKVISDTTLAKKSKSIIKDIFSNYTTLENPDKILLENYKLKRTVIFEILNEVDDHYDEFMDQSINSEFNKINTSEYEKKVESIYEREEALKRVKNKIPEEVKKEIFHNGYHLKKDYKSLFECYGLFENPDFEISTEGLEWDIRLTFLKKLEEVGLMEYNENEELYKLKNPKIFENIKFLENRE